jgi:hypothetical protein
LSDEQQELATERDRYADLRSRGHTHAAHTLVWRISCDIREHERTTGGRVRGTGARMATKLTLTLDRLVGDLLRARTGDNATGRIYRPIGKSDFTDAPFDVKYDIFMRVLEGLKALGFVEHRKGRTRYLETGFAPGHKVTRPGRASRFWATPKLLKLADEYGINSNNVNDHFLPEPPTNPLVLKDYATGRGQNKEKGPKVKYTPTPETKRLEGDVRELNDFLARVKLTGGRHEGYQRTFNNRSWQAGGRLYSVGGDNYQLMSEAERLKVTINGEPVVEIDIKASQLTIYHAMVGEPLDAHSDPYARVGIGRDIAKLWCVETLGNGAPKTRWSSDTIKEYREKGQDLPKATPVAKAMLEAFPALKRLEEHPKRDLWADLQFKEAEAIVSTMLVLKRRHGVPSLSMHDGLIVPRSKWELAHDILKREFRRVVGVEPMLTVEPDPETFDARYL